MSDAVGTALADLRMLVRHRIGKPATSMPEACDEVVVTALRFWPEKTMAEIARKNVQGHVLDAIPVITAKVREDLEARWGTDANTLSAIDQLVSAVIVELAHLWFASVESRISIRRCIAVVRLLTA